MGGESFRIVRDMYNGIPVSDRLWVSHGSYGSHVDSTVEMDTFSDDRPEFFMSKYKHFLGIPRSI